MASLLKSIDRKALMVACIGGMVSGTLAVWWQKDERQFMRGIEQDLARIAQEDQARLRKIWDAEERQELEVQRRRQKEVQEYRNKYEKPRAE